MDGQALRCLRAKAEQETAQPFHLQRLFHEANFVLLFKKRPLVTYFITRDEVALEKGIDFFFEIVFYSIIIGLPLFELYRNQVESDEKSRLQKEKMEAINTKIETLGSRFSTLESENKQIQERTSLGI